MPPTLWCPPLPSIGRAGPRTQVANATFEDRLREYVVKTTFLPDIFVRRISPARLRKIGINVIPKGGKAPYLADLTTDQQMRVLLKNLYVRMSAHFCRKLRQELSRKGGLQRVRQWYLTSNGILIPYLISSNEESYETIDGLIKFSLENCANNYSHFIKRLKTLKKRMRKAFATRDNSHLKEMRDMARYISVYQRESRLSHDEREKARKCLIFTQTRATGLADHKMMVGALEKFKGTIVQESKPVMIDEVVLERITRPILGLNTDNARVSAGPKACLESPQHKGGQTGFLSRLSRTKSLYREYDFENLSYKTIGPRTVKSSEDLLSWAIQESQVNPVRTLTVRAHVVAEPSKARVITVASYAYQCIQGVCAHMIAPLLRNRRIRSGMKASRHLWNFLYKELHPSDTWCQKVISPGENWALSSDLEEATDYGNINVAKRIWYAILVKVSQIDGAPLSLFYTAMRLFTSPRLVLFPEGKGASYVIKSRGWFMGDMMTKIILTLAQQYCAEKALIPVSSHVGDDVTAISKDKDNLGDLLKELKRLDFKISEDDTFISNRLMFYCEEGSLIPQHITDMPSVAIKRGLPLIYLDYPRIRLLLPVIQENDLYSATNLGRFHLLGKEMRWAIRNNDPAVPYFKRAVLLQCLLVPQDPDTMCPFTPIEMGGNGVFPPDPDFLRDVILSRSRDRRETRYRISSLVNDRWSFRFVRSERTNEVVHKHHIIQEKLDDFRKLLPECSIVPTESRSKNIMFRSIKYSGLEEPQYAMMRVMRSLYYKDLFAGKVPIEPKFSASRMYNHAMTESEPNYSDFWNAWLETGFTYRNFDKYLVLRDKVKVTDFMSLKFPIRGIRFESSRRLLREWIPENISLIESGQENLVQTLMNSETLPHQVRDRLHLFVESDEVIMQELEREPAHDDIILVSQDARLAARMGRYVRSRGGQGRIWMIHPSLFLIGRIWDFGPGDNIARFSPEYHTVTDPGAVYHSDIVDFTDGVPPDWVWGEKTIIRPHRRYRSVYQLSVDN